jgi:DNA-binding CsgD family transcriptional regulator
MQRINTPNADGELVPHIRLAPGEVRLLAQLVHLATNREIAHRLGCSRGTAKNRIRQLCRDLNVADRHELARWGSEHATALQREPVDPRPHVKNCTCDWCRAMKATDPEPGAPAEYSRGT